jgi:hypothetical protein
MLEFFYSLILRSVEYNWSSIFMLFNIPSCPIFKPINFKALYHYNTFKIWSIKIRRLLDLASPIFWQHNISTFQYVKIDFQSPWIFSPARTPGPARPSNPARQDAVQVHCRKQGSWHKCRMTITMIIAESSRFSHVWANCWIGGIQWMRSFSFHPLGWVLVQLP